MDPLSPEVIDGLRKDRATRERKLAVCSTGANLEPADRAEILVVLANDPDEMVAERAGEALISQPLENFLAALKRQEAVAALFEYASQSLVGKPGVADELAANKNCPARFLIPHAQHLSPGSVSALMSELDRVSDSGGLAAALLKSTSLTLEHKQILTELLGTETLEQTGEISEVLAEAAVEAEPDAAKRATLIQRLAMMTVAQRVQFALKGGSEARRTLIRDSNKVVQRAVLQSPRLTDQEVEAFASQSSLTDETLRHIATNRNFRKNYTVVRNLLGNGKTPLDVSLHMLPMLNAIDLKKLTTNKNVPETLRSSAVKLQKVRSEFKK